MPWVEAVLVIPAACDIHLEAGLADTAIGQAGRQHTASGMAELRLQSLAHAAGEEVGRGVAVAQLQDADLLAAGVLQPRQLLEEGSQCRRILALRRDTRGCRSGDLRSAGATRQRQRDQSRENRFHRPAV